MYTKDDQQRLYLLRCGLRIKASRMRIVKALLLLIPRGQNTSKDWHKKSDTDIIDTAINVCYY